MQRSSFPWFWIALAALLLLIPGRAGRVLLDLLGGLTLLVFVLPLLVIGAGLLAWQVIYPRLTTCPACGVKSFGTEVCPACGAPYGPGSRPDPTRLADDMNAVSAGQVTIDVEAVDVPPPADSDHQRPPTA